MQSFRFAILGLTFLFYTSAGAQTDTTVIRLDSLPPGTTGDSLVQSKVAFPDSTIELPQLKKGRWGRFFTKNYPDPGKAALFSLILPGAGQAYNKKWWKLPIVYGGLGGLLWLEIDNIKEYRLARDAYAAVVDTDPNTQPTGKFAGREAVSIKDYRDTFRRYVEQTSLALGIVYLAVAADAFVDAHLSRFDVSEDLSLKVGAKPTFGGPAFGLSLAAPLNKNRK